MTVRLMSNTWKYQQGRKGSLWQINQSERERRLKRSTFVAFASHNLRYITMHETMMETMKSNK